MVKLSKTAKILIATGATLLTGALLFGKKSKAANLNQYSLPANSSIIPNTGIIVTNHDAVYDYKYENGTWFTRKKGTNNWVNMQTALSAKNYQLAVSRLKKYVQ